jgi:hypothetical protein
MHVATACINAWAYQMRYSVYYCQARGCVGARLRETLSLTPALDLCLDHPILVAEARPRVNEELPCISARAYQCGNLYIIAKLGDASGPDLEKRSRLHQLLTCVLITPYRWPRQDRGLTKNFHSQFPGNLLGIKSHPRAVLLTILYS